MSLQDTKFCSALLAATQNTKFFPDYIKLCVAIVQPKRQLQPKPKQGRTAPPIKRRPRLPDDNISDSEKMPFRRPEWETAEHLAWAFENGRADVLAEYGIYADPEP